MNILAQTIFDKLTSTDPKIILIYKTSANAEISIYQAPEQAPDEAVDTIHAYQSIEIRSVISELAKDSGVEILLLGFSQYPIQPAIDCLGQKHALSFGSPIPPKRVYANVANNNILSSINYVITKDSQTTLESVLNDIIPENSLAASHSHETQEIKEKSLITVVTEDQKIGALNYYQSGESSFMDKEKQKYEQMHAGDNNSLAFQASTEFHFSATLSYLKTLPEGRKPAVTFMHATDVKMMISYSALLEIFIEFLEKVKELQGEVVFDRDAYISHYDESKKDLRTLQPPHNEGFDQLEELIAAIMKDPEAARRKIPGLPKEDSFINISEYIEAVLASNPEQHTEVASTSCLFQPTSLSTTGADNRQSPTNNL